MSTFQKVIDRVDNYRVDPPTETLYKFILHPSAQSSEPSSPIVIGYIRAPVLPLLPDSVFAVSHSSKTVQFDDSLDSFNKRSEAVANLCTQWRDEGKFSETIGGRLWRNELYTVYWNPFKRGDAAFAMERVCCALFGLVTYVRLQPFAYSSS